MSPILSYRARNETPKIGSGNALASIPRTSLSLKSHIILSLVSDEAIVDPPTPDFHDVLDVRYKLDMASQVKIRSIIQEILKPFHKSSSIGDAPRVADFIRSNSPTRCRPPLASPPLFARADRTIQKAEQRKCIKLGHSAMDCVADIAPMLKHAQVEVIEEEEGDIHGQHMQVINEWSTYTISSPPSYHSESTSSSDVDELWDISPPRSPATSLIVGKMEEIEIPRIRKFGYGSQRVGQRGELTDSGVGILSTAKSLGSFITSVIPQDPVPVIYNESVTPCWDTVPVSQPYHTGLPLNHCSPTHSTANSLMGQAPSTVEEQKKNTKFPTAGEDGVSLETDLDTVISRIYTSSRDPVLCVLEEKLDEKEVLLMDVPNLPPPTAYPRDRRLCFERMSSLLSAKGSNSISANDIRKDSSTGTIGFLSPVKGLKPLALDLSWIPFKFGRSIPTNEEVVRVADKFHPENDIAGYVDPKIEADIRRLCASPQSVPLDDQGNLNTVIVLRGFENLGASPVPKQDNNRDEVEYVLTRQERNKLAANMHIPGDEDEDEGKPMVDRRQRRHSRLQVPLGFEGIEQRDYDTECYEHQNLDYRDVNDVGPCEEPQSCGFRCRIASRSGDDGVSDSLQDPEDPPDYDRVHNLGRGYYSEEVEELEASKENINNNTNVTGFANPPDSDIQEDTNFNVDPPGSDYESPASAPYWNEKLTITLDSISHLTEDTKDGGIRKSCLSHAVIPTDKRLVERSIEVLQEEHASKRRKLDHLLPATAKDLFATFLGLKGIVPPLVSPPDRPATLPGGKKPNFIESPQRSIPDDIVDKSTARLAQWNNATTIHRYLASITLIQKRALVLELQGEACKVTLVERYALGGCDIVLDPDHAVLLVPLLALPSQVEVLSERISAESWRYSSILVVFEAYPSARSSRVGDTRSSAPIAEGCGSKNKQCSVIWAFASGVKEAAMFVRCFGDEAWRKAVGNASEVLWGQREWLLDEEQEVSYFPGLDATFKNYIFVQGESDLAGTEGMNPFAAIVMLCGRTLEDILEMSPQMRLEEFRGLIGQERVVG
ncbi:hypothetical protein J3A83DRAFT_3170224 [Scleroderma citrinum]